ncbi:hypothetical protein PYW07_001311 [Mythimna separata]|uniref:Reverse transcriptase domain-containing protein n=1 Tax=Mythimna separata TaxID=271217 RepID=A0AAD7YUS1_MYTSE|nr:hypothetical protein PYW07_001311 [Mythimna separata]
MTNLYKIFSKVILNRVTKILDENQPCEQAGFRKKYSTTDHLQVVTQVIEKANEYGKTIYMCFVDYQKAFDSLHYDAIWTALSRQGIDAKYINLIKSVYSKCRAKVKLEREGVEFPVQKGVRQGDPLSPKLFSAVLESVFRCLEWDNKGIKVNGELLSHLRFADDIVVFAETATELECMISELAIESKKVGLSLNASKTKIITNGEYQDVIIENAKIEFVDDYVYLGQLVSFENCIEKEINRRIALAWRKYWGLKEIMKSKEISLHIKKKVYETAILPCLVYGCQTWSLRREDEEKIAICQRKMERSMLCIKKLDKIKNEIIRRKTKLTDVKQRIRLLKWNWAGHVCRLECTRWTKRATEWIPLDGKRKQGRQRKRWRDIFTQRCGPNWMQKARDRQAWSDLGEAYAAEATATNSENEPE